MLGEHRPNQVRVVAGLAHDLNELFESGLPLRRIAKSVCDPDVSFAIDAKSASAIAGLEGLGLARIGSREANDGVPGGTGHPDPILLVDARWNGPLNERQGSFSKLWL